MPSFSSDARFMGVDLAILWKEVRQSWRNMHEWPVLSWLTPPAPIRLFQVDGTQSVWLGEVRQPAAAASRRVPFVAVELPDDLVLGRSLSLPVMGERETASALELEARSASPFADADLAWGYRLDGQHEGMRRARIVVASRKQIEQFLATRPAVDGVDVANGKLPEVWAQATGDAPVILAGFGEARRAQYAARRRWLGYGLVLSALALAAACAITPTAQLRLRAIEAVHDYDDVHQRTVGTVRQREKLLQSIEQLTSLSGLLAGQVDALRVLEKLTQLLPDDTSLLGLKFQGNKLTLTGLTANAANLMQLLGNQAGFKDVRSPAAATRAAGGKEAFTIELMLDLQQFGVPNVKPPTEAAPTQAGAPAAAEPVPSPAAATAPTPPAAPQAGNAPAPATAPAASPAPASAAAPPQRAQPAAPAAPAGRGPVFGGSGPTFGGAPTRPAPNKSSSSAP